MNSREKRLFLRLQECLHDQASLYPDNPCDIEAIATRFRLTTEASRELFHAAVNIGFCDYDDADERLTRCESLLSEAKQFVSQRTRQASPV